jgi:hypothetical protein
MGSNRNISNHFFAAVSMGSELELREILEAEGREITIDAAQSYNEQGETPLLVAIRRKHIGVVKFLVSELKVDIGQSGRFAWKGLDHSQIPPLFAAIISGQVAIVDYLISVENLDTPSIPMSSIMSSSISRQEKIDALELMGSAYIFYGEETARGFGLPCWMQAMTLRQSTTRGQPEIPKNLHHSSELVRKAMGDAVEFNTPQQLHLLTNEPHNQLITQANIVSNRILKKISPGTNPCTCTQLLNYSRHYWTENEYGRVISITMLILESFDLSDEDQYFDGMNDIINSALTIVSNSLLMLRRESANTSGHEELSFANLMKVVDFAFTHCRSRTNESFRARTMDSMNEWALWPENYIGDLIVLLHDMDLSQQEKHLFRKSIFRFISLDHRSSYQRNLLHMICLMPVIPNDVIQLLLELGADPNATDEDGNTALHLLAKNQWTHFDTNAARILMDFGGHLDHANKFGTTVTERLKYRMRCLIRQGSFDASLQALINRVLPLSCCSARVIRQNQIDIRALPPSLQEFVRRH